MEEELTLREQIEETIKTLEEEGFDFDEEVALVYWSYPDMSDFSFQLAIVKGELLDEVEQQVLH